MSKDWESNVPVHITDDAISWIGDGWRFYISNDDDHPYWGFVNNHGELIMETAYLSSESINKIIELCREGLDAP